MSFVIQDLGDEERFIRTNSWSWKTILILIERLEVLPAGAIEPLQYNEGAEVSESNARRIAQVLRDKVLPALPPEHRMMANGTITDEPDDGALHQDDPWKDYSVSHESLVEFAEFCERCAGFRVE